MPILLTDIMWERTEYGYSSTLKIWEKAERESFRLFFFPIFQNRRETESR